MKPVRRDFSYDTAEASRAPGYLARKFRAIERKLKDDELARLAALDQERREREANEVERARKVKALKVKA